MKRHDSDIGQSGASAPRVGPAFRPARREKRRLPGSSTRHGNLKVGHGPSGPRLVMTTSSADAASMLTPSFVNRCRGTRRNAASTAGDVIHRSARWPRAHRQRRCRARIQPWW